MVLMRVLMLLAWAVSPGLTISNNYYIIPNEYSGNQSGGSQCFTLQQLSETLGNGSSNIVRENATFILIFAPGNHFLSGGITFNTTNEIILSGASGASEISCNETSCFVFNNISKVHIENLVFRECTSEYFSGAALFVSHTEFLNISQCSFIANSVRELGGALRVTNSILVIIKKCRFINNSALCPPLEIHNILGISWCAASCVVRGGAISVINSTHIVIRDSLFDGNAASMFGGAVSSIRTNLSVHNSLFIGNTAICVNGQEAGVFIFESNAQFSNISFVYNRAFFGFNNFLIDNDVCNSQGGALLAYRSNVQLSNSSFRQNLAYCGGAVFSYDSNIETVNCYFSSNLAYLFGGATYSINNVLLILGTQYDRNIVIDGAGGAIAIAASASHSGSMQISNTTLFGNDAKDGGAIYLSLDESPICMTLCNYTINSSKAVVSVTHSVFELNFAQIDGGAINMKGGMLNISSSFFIRNRGGSLVGAVTSRRGALYIQSSTFIHNSAVLCAAVYTTNGTLYSSNNAYRENNCTLAGTVYVSYSTAVMVQDHYISNRASQNGGAIMAVMAHFSTKSCLYFNNSNIVSGGAIIAIEGEFHSIDSSYYINTVSALRGGAVFLDRTTTSFSGDVFWRNKAGEGAAIYQTGGYINMHNLTFTENYARDGTFGYTVQLINLFGHLDGLTFNTNIGSVYMFYCTVNFSGLVSMTNNTCITGGALTSLQSTLTIEKLAEVNIFHNSAKYGGAILLTQSAFTVYSSAVIIANNRAMISGGGVFSYQSQIRIDLACQQITGCVTFTRNEAVEGGAMYQVSTSLNIVKGFVLFTENRASRGGAIFLSESSRLYILKEVQETLPNISVSLSFSKNTAEYGGALFVSDESNSGTICETSRRSVVRSISTRECFIQSLRLYYPQHPDSFDQSNYFNIFFRNNTASASGNDIYGGLLDRCRLNPFSEVDINFQLYGFAAGFNGLQTIKVIAKFDINVDYDQVAHPYSPQRVAESILNKQLKNLISSSPVQLCFCTNITYNCSTINQTIFRKRGERFSVTVVTVDQVENPVNGTVRTSVISSRTRLEVDQSYQETNRVCTELFYNVFSTQHNVTIQLYPDGPCGNMGVSSKNLSIIFLPCECPNGLQPAPIENDCRCECDSTLDSIISQCLLDNGNLTVVRRTEDVWIQYINNDSTTGFFYSKCPFDYCLVEPLNLSFSLPSQVDRQCAHNRSGVLCGECEEGLSLVFGSSRCALCSSNYLALLITFAAAGIALVAFILILNLTVAIGTIHGLVLYANIVAANSPIFLPSETTLRLFVSWVNLDLGIETCFYDSMDSYAKVLLQLVFPTYIISLSAMIIVVSFYWSKFAGLIGRKNPVATLCTLFLLSYSKLLQTIISSLQFTQLTYPSGMSEILWLYNPNIPYFTPARIPMFIIAGVILILGIIYTILLFCGQWLRKLQRVKCLQSSKYYAFIDAYHAPFSFKYRYWIGILLVTRIFHHLLTAILSESTHLLMVSCLMGMLLIIKQIIIGAFKNWLVNLLETSFLINILLFAVCTYYTSLTNGDQVTIANASVTVAFITFYVIVLCHFHRYFLKSFRMYIEFTEKVKNFVEATKLKIKKQAERETRDAVRDTPASLRMRLIREPALDIIAPITAEDYVPPTNTLSNPVIQQPTTSTVDIRKIDD